jgi:hypothetical protein
MRRFVSRSLFFTTFFAATAVAFAQSDYNVTTVTDGGTISGTVQWAGLSPHAPTFPITKDPQICDPDSVKTRDLERLIVGPQGGVANTIVYLKNITSGKALQLPEQRRHLNQKQCRYIPHILLVHLRCNGGHVWMNAEMMVVSHPYYAVTDESGSFEFTDVPSGTYQIVAWHEGWNLLGKEHAYDALTARSIERPLFSEPKTWEKSVTVSGNQVSTVNFVISNK